MQNTIYESRISQKKSRIISNKPFTTPVRSPSPDLSTQNTLRPTKCIIMDRVTNSNIVNPKNKSHHRSNQKMPPIGGISLIQKNQIKQLSTNNQEQYQNREKRQFSSYTFKQQKATEPTTLSPNRQNGNLKKSIDAQTLSQSDLQKKQQVARNIQKIYNKNINQEKQLSQNIKIIDSQNSKLSQNQNNLPKNDWDYGRLKTRQNDEITINDVDSSYISKRMLAIQNSNLSNKSNNHNQNNQQLVIRQQHRDISRLRNMISKNGSDVKSFYKQFQRSQKWYNQSDFMQKLERINNYQLKQQQQSIIIHGNQSEYSLASISNTKKKQVYKQNQKLQRQLRKLNLQNSQLRNQIQKIKSKLNSHSNSKQQIPTTLKNPNYQNLIPRQTSSLKYSTVQISSFNNTAFGNTQNKEDLLQKQQGQECINFILTAPHKKIQNESNKKSIIFQTNRILKSNNNRQQICESSSEQYLFREKQRINIDNKQQDRRQLLRQIQNLKEINNLDKKNIDFWRNKFFQQQQKYQQLNNNYNRQIQNKNNKQLRQYDYIINNMQKIQQNICKQLDNTGQINLQKIKYLLIQFDNKIINIIKIRNSLMCFKQVIQKLQKQNQILQLNNQKYHHQIITYQQKIDFLIKQILNNKNNSKLFQNQKYNNDKQQNNYLKSQFNNILHKYDNQSKQLQQSKQTIHQLKKLLQGYASILQQDQRQNNFSKSNTNNHQQIHNLKSKIINLTQINQNLKSKLQVYQKSGIINKSINSKNKIPSSIFGTPTNYKNNNKFKNISTIKQTLKSIQYSLGQFKNKINTTQQISQQEF